MRPMVRFSVSLSRWLLGAVPFTFALWAAALPAPAFGRQATSAPEPAAAPAAAPAADTAKEEGVVEEITVTARKKEETIQNVPLSVAAPSEEDLRNRGADSIESVASNVAGFTVQNLGPGQSQVAIRGVSAGQIVRDQPGVKEQVGVYLDESVISLSLFTPDIDLFDMNRIEVLRGPQGTLFGSGSLSGTVRYITNQPELGVSQTVGELGVSSISGGDTGGNVKVAVNLPVGQRSALRVTGFYNNIAGYVDAIQPDLSVKQDANSGTRTGGRLAFRFQPNDRLTITPRILYQEVKMDGWNRQDGFNILANPYTTTRPAVHIGDLEQFTQIDEPFTDKFTLTDLSIEAKGSAVSFNSITSYSHRDVLVVRDATALTASITGGSIGLPANVYTLDAPLDDATDAKVFTQEFRLSGGQARFSWVAGAFYSDMKRDYGQNLLVAGFETATGIPTAGSHGAVRDSLYFSDLHYKFKQFAVFGEGTLAFGDSFELTGGLRYYDFEEDRVQTFDGIFADAGTTRGSTDANGVAPRMIASYAVNANTKINAQVSKGFRLGGINDPLNAPLCTPADLATFGGHGSWKDEDLWNYEIGSKSSIMGGRGSFNISGYYMNIKNLQATVTAGSCSSRVVFNVPKARSTGIELEFSAAPTSSFDFSISASYNQAELRSTLTSTDAAGHVTVVSGIKAGNRLPTVPEFQAALAATYQHPIGNTLLGYATGTYQHVGSRFTQIGDQEDNFGILNIGSFGANTIGGPLTGTTYTFNPELPSYDIVNLRVGVLIGRWDVALYGNNLSDERALLALDQERGRRARVGFLTNQPRTFGITTRVHFN